MPTCPHPDCDWRPIAPTHAGALEQIASHLFEIHAGEGDEGTVEDDGSAGEGGGVSGDGEPAGAPVEVHREDGVWEFTPRDPVESTDEDDAG